MGRLPAPGLTPPWQGESTPDLGLESGSAVRHRVVLGKELSLLVYKQRHLIGLQ